MTTATTPQLEQLAVNTIRMLSVDAVQQANSGHPGAPMGAAAMAFTLWTRVLRHNPADPDVARPRSLRPLRRARLDAALCAAAPHRLRSDARRHLKAFRQWDSRTPGHPERGPTPGVETTTGPLGQGFANAVGMAIAERWLAARFNRPGHAIVDHCTYVIASATAT